MAIPPLHGKTALVTGANTGIGRVTAMQLAAAGALLPGSIAFHASGALSSDALAALRGGGVHLASAHPLRSFADPALAADDFPGTWAAVEGDPVALELLERVFTAIGARVTRLDPAGKSATVRQMIDARVNGEAPKKYDIPKPKIERCLLGHEQNIIYSFDDVCSDPSTGGMGAIEKRLTDVFALHPELRSSGHQVMAACSSTASRSWSSVRVPSTIGWRPPSRCKSTVT